MLFLKLGSKNSTWWILLSSILNLWQLRSLFLSFSAFYNGTFLIFACAFIMYFVRSWDESDLEWKNISWKASSCIIFICMVAAGIALIHVYVLLVKTGVSYLCRAANSLNDSTTEYILFQICWSFFKIMATRTDLFCKDSRIGFLSTTMGCSGFKLDCYCWSAFGNFVELFVC